MNKVFVYHSCMSDDVHDIEVFDNREDAAEFILKRRDQMGQSLVHVRAFIGVELEIVAVEVVKSIRLK